MTNVDILLVAGFIFLILVVLGRIWIGRRNAAQIDPNIKIKKPEMAKPVSNQEAEIPDHRKNIPSDNVQKQADTRAQDLKSEMAENVGNFNTKDNDDASESSSEGVAESIADPLVLIRTFSASTEKRLIAIKSAAQQNMIEAVPALIEALYEPDSAISLAAAEALGELGDERAIEPLLEISRRNDARLMRDIADSTDIKNNSGKESDDEEQNEEAQDNPYNFKEMVLFKIDQLPQEYFQPDGTPIPRKELVVKGLKDNNQQLRQMAAKVAIGLDEEDVVEPLIEALENPYEVESVRFMAAEALGGMSDERSIDSLLKALKDENVAVRYSAAASLSGKKEDRIIDALINATNDADKFVRSSVAYALGASAQPKAMEALFDCINDESEVVRFSAAKALACYAADAVVNEAGKRLKTADSNLKW